MKAEKRLGVGLPEAEWGVLVLTQSHATAGLGPT